MATRLQGKLHTQNVRELAAMTRYASGPSLGDQCEAQALQLRSALQHVQRVLLLRAAMKMIERLAQGVHAQQWPQDRPQGPTTAGHLPRVELEPRWRQRGLETHGVGGRQRLHGVVREGAGGEEREGSLCDAYA